MGSVYLAQPLEGGRLVALKVIRADLAGEPDFRRRFRGEVARAQQVPAFCTAEVLDADPDHDPPYLVVEFVNGPSLARVVADQGPMSPANLHGLAIGVATALTAIHGAGVIHRDLKPANVLLALGSPKVIDFGIARVADGTGLTDTNSNGLIGTIAYMAPERLDPGAARPLTQAADVFAWGSVVTFAGTGRPPFGNGTLETAARILAGQPDLTGLTDELSDLVGQSLAKDPADRPTARELLDRLVVGGAGQTLQLIEAGSRQAVVTVAASSDTTRLEAGPAEPAVVRRKPRVGLLAASAVILLALAAATTMVFRDSWLKPDALADEGSVPSASAPGTPGTVVLEETLDRETVWFKTNLQRTSPTLRTDCLIDDGLTVTKLGKGTFRCPSHVNFYRDFLVEVDVTLRDAQSCAGIWFRFSGEGEAGYLLTVCDDRYMLGNHNDAEGGLIYFKTIPLWQKAEEGKPMRVGIRAVGNRLTFSQDGRALEDPFEHERYRIGKVLLGISTPSSAAEQSLYEVSFRNIRITDLGRS